MATIGEALQVERLERDIFRGEVVPTRLQRTFGGQVAGQAMVSAVRTVDPEFGVHSLHGYFLRGGNPLAPTVYLVDRVRDGRSFVTRRVVGIQDGQAIFSMSASFHKGDRGIEHQDDMPEVPPPEQVADLAEMRVGDGDWLTDWEHWELRRLAPEQVVRTPGTAAQQQIWFRYRHRLPDNPVVHVCGLTYVSDMSLLLTSKTIHPDAKTQVASLDHALWFLRPFRTDEWLLYDMSSPSAGFGRAFTQGRIFDRNGVMVAAVVQEGLQRLLRDPGS